VVRRDWAVDRFLPSGAAQAESVGTGAEPQKFIAEVNHWKHILDLVEAVART